MSCRSVHNQRTWYPINERCNPARRRGMVSLGATGGLHTMQRMLIIMLPRIFPLTLRPSLEFVLVFPVHSVQIRIIPPTKVRETNSKARDRFAQQLSHHLLSFQNANNQHLDSGALTPSTKPIIPSTRTVSTGKWHASPRIANVRLG